MTNLFRLKNMQIDGTGIFSFWCWLWMSYSLLEWFSVISLILNFSRLLLIKAGLNRLKLIKATGWHKFNLSRLFSNPGYYTCPPYILFGRLPSQLYGTFCDIRFFFRKVFSSETCKWMISISILMFLVQKCLIIDNFEACQKWSEDCGWLRANSSKWFFKTSRTGNNYKITRYSI